MDNDGDNEGVDRAREIRRLAACFEGGDFAAAEDIARRLVAADPRDEEALHLLAQTVFKQERAVEAIELMKAVLDIEPARASYHNDYGVMFASLERWHEAAEAYGIAAVLDGNDFCACFNLALALSHIGQKERARAELDRALALRPDQPEALALDSELSRVEGDRVFVEQVFGSGQLNYRIVRARHGWMLVNPNDFYVGQALLEYGEFSEIEAKFLHQCLFKPGRIVEVGANLGGHTVGLAKAAAAKGEKMEVFEPQPVVFQNLCANLALNGLRNVRAWPFACGDEAGTVTFAEPDYGRPGNFGGVKMSRAEAGQGRIPAPCVRLDDFLGEQQAVALIKIDVEGFELAVLRGADNILKRWRPLLCVENDRVAASKDLIEWLWSREYRLFWHIPRMFNPDNFFGQTTNLYGNVASFNMICLPKELHQGNMPDMDEIVDSAKHPLLKNRKGT
ncbi:MAG: FkbM family methyltransferase [Candidatus Accumulibacter sp.]|jgi:FkbM family methyltransferase|nr:FkbM family methyltransferase [Accumulibacter sp.]